MAKRRRTSKPIADHIETATPADNPPPASEPASPLAETPVPEQAVAVQVEPPAQSDAAARIEAAVESVPGVMRGSELQAPGEEVPEQDGTKGPNHWAGVVRDSAQGIRIDKETERKHGVPYLRVLISFRDDNKPSAEERALLKDEGFRFDDGSWGKELTGANVLLAKQVVNRIYQMRGEDAQLFLG
jgi:hypothetical protein